MSIADRNRIEELERRVQLLEQQLASQVEQLMKALGKREGGKRPNG